MLVIKNHPPMLNAAPEKKVESSQGRYIEG